MGEKRLRPNAQRTLPPGQFRAVLLKENRAEEDEGTHSRVIRRRLHTHTVSSEPVMCTQPGGAHAEDKVPGCIIGNY